MPPNEWSRPKLDRKVRLRVDRRDGGLLLLYPERGLRLNGPAGQVVQLCTGELTIRGMADVLMARHRLPPRNDVLRDVLAFVNDLWARGLVQL